MHVGGYITAMNNNIALGIPNARRHTYMRNVGTYNMYMK